MNPSIHINIAEMVIAFHRQPHSKILNSLRKLQSNVGHELFYSVFLLTCCLCSLKRIWQVALYFEMPVFYVALCVTLIEGELWN